VAPKPRLNVLAAGRGGRAARAGAGTLLVMRTIAAGDPTGGPIAALPRGERFHWLVAPRSAIIQPSPVHTGLCHDPALSLAQLVERLVLPPR
jgi:hypothetical protein